MTNEVDISEIHVGDVIKGRRVTKVYMLCGCTAFDTEPIEDNAKDYTAEPAKKPVEEPKEAPKRRARKKKE